MISDFIPVGKVNAVSRKWLSEVTGLSDRQVRQLIASERERGAPIISSSKSAGYYLAETEAEKQIILRELGTRISKLAKEYRAISKTVKPDGQMDFALDELAINMIGASVDYMEGVRQ